MSELIILGASFLAVGLMVALAAWARIGRPVAPLDEPAARALLAAEFPDRRPGRLWIAGDGAGVVARDGDDALIVYRLGDSWVARSLSWDEAVAAPVQRGQVRFRLRDPAAPVARLTVSGVNPWPPEHSNKALAA